MRKALLLVALSLLLFSLVACGDSAVEYRTPPTVSTDDVPPAATGVAAELEKLVRNAEGLNYEVAYVIDSTSESGSAAGKLTLYADGAGNFRSDSDIAGPNATMVTRSYVDAERFTVCADEDGWECYYLPVDEADVGTEIDPDFTGLSVTRTADEMILDEARACYRVVSDEMTEFSEQVCYSDEGVPLLIETSGPLGTLLQRAERYEVNDVTAQEMALPAEAEPFPEEPALE